MDFPQYAENAEQLRMTVEALPKVVDDAIDGTATFAAVLSDLVQTLDARRIELNEQAHALGLRPLPDVVTACVPSSDTVRAGLIAAARRGAAQTAVRLGEAAQGPASKPDAALTVKPGTGPGEAARAAAALLTWTHHRVDDVEPQDLIAGADPVQTAQMLAGVALDLAARVMPGEGAVSEWIASVGAAWALDGD